MVSELSDDHAAGSVLLRLLLATSSDAKVDMVLQATGSEPVRLLSETSTPMSLVSVDQAAGSDP